MPHFEYKAKDADGNISKEVIEAKDRFDVYKQVRKEGRTILSVEKKEGTDFKKYLSFKYLSSVIGTVKVSEKIILTRNLAAMIEAGLPISRALAVMERQTGNPVLRKVIIRVNQDIKKGITFHEALEKHPSVFSKLFTSMVRAGEESGSLAGSLRIVGEQMTRSYELRKRIRGALIYPAIVVMAMIIIGFLMLIYVVPTLTGTFDELGAELPVSTRTIIALSDFLIENTFAAIGLVLILIGGFVAALRTNQGKRVFQFVLLHLPIIGSLVKETNAARTARTLSSLLSSGVEVVGALTITKDVIQNLYFKDVIKIAMLEIQEGAPISKVFIEHDHLYPILFGEILSAGEETGKLSSMLLEIAEFYEGEVSQKTKDMSTVIEPFLMLIVGAGVGFFAVSMIMPIYSLSDSI